ncbi:3D domain-containing protein [Heliophilum fasciatum]|uniref:Uncharacterized protein DUF348 n=1 Tax=Heliophilum fasciatum TaxID=35700 RepID=A0A4R2RY72_9FIRM|nr:3D domain-containing protein [Heliophilum fasciatum]MCW2277006.1 uncharacterized protein YabE (DUF348 family) [Heliophilum fasciatum]TCP68468.1 uncharacterized protein DUF348 [Heliophilum fasciatum]
MSDGKFGTEQRRRLSQPVQKAKSLADGIWPGIQQMMQHMIEFGKSLGSRSFEGWARAWSMIPTLFQKREGSAIRRHEPGATMPVAVAGEVSDDTVSTVPSGAWYAHFTGWFQGGPQKAWIVAVVLLLLSGWGGYHWMENQIIIDVDGNPMKVSTFKKTVSEALAEKEIVLGEKDRLEPEPQTKLADGTVIKVTRAFSVNVWADGKQKVLLTTPRVVKDLLAEAQIEVKPLDRVEPSLETLVDQPQKVRVIRVRQKEITTEQVIPFRVAQQSDPNLERGLRRIVSRGKNGLERHKARITYEDGKEVRREIVEQKVIRPPVNQVVAMGTIDHVSRGGLDLHIKEARYMSATAYTHTGNNTASGVYPEVGMAAVDSSVIPLGSRLYVEGYGFARAMDRGGAIVGDKIDLFMETNGEARRWGKRNVKVYVLK